MEEGGGGRMGGGERGRTGEAREGGRKERVEGSEGRVNEWVGG